jgi:Flp pilus assembly protein TadG
MNVVWNWQAATIRGVCPPRAARGKDQGQSAVEFALLLPLLLLFFFFLIEFGRVFGSWLLITNAAREGARYAAVQDFGCTGDTNCTNTNAAIISWVQKTASFLTVQAVACSSNQPPGGSTSCVSVTRVTCPDANYTALCNNSSDRFVIVQVAYQVQTLMPITGSVPFVGAVNYPGSLLVAGLSSMRAEQ